MTVQTPTPEATHPPQTPHLADASKTGVAPLAVDAWLGLGGNLGDPRSAVLAAMDAIAALPQVSLQARSSLWCSTPVDAGGPDYINAVVHIRTPLACPALLQALQTLEHQAGRERPWRNAPRTLDLDILLYGDLHWSTPQLTIPHPRMYQRAFVLRPLAEIAPWLVTATQLAAVQEQGVWRL